MGFYDYKLAATEEEEEMYFVVCFEITSKPDGREEAIYEIVSGGETLGNKSYRECTVVSRALTLEEAECELRLLTEETEFSTEDFRFFVGAEFICVDEYGDAIFEDCIFATDANEHLFVVTDVSDDFRTFHARKANREVAKWLTLKEGFKNIPEEVSLRKAYFDVKCV